MKRSTRLQQISRLAQQREEVAGRKLAESRQAVENQQKQLQQLQDYLTEYTRPTMDNTGIPARQLSDRRQFLFKLNGAVEQQKNSVNRSGQLLEESHRTWLESRQRVKALDKAIEKMRRDELNQELRLEQTQTDELASRNNFQGNPLQSNSSQK